MVLVAPLDDAVADVVAVVAAGHNMVVVAVSVHVHVLMVVMPARAVLVVLRGGGRRDQDGRGRDQSCKARLHGFDLSDCSEKDRPTALDAI